MPQRKSSKSAKPNKSAKQSGGAFLKQIDILNGESELKMDNFLISQDIRPFPDNCVIM